MTDHIVVFNGHDRLLGQLVEIDVTDASGFTLYGDVRLSGRDDVVVPRTVPPTAKGRKIGLNLV